jgi:hypothetical protein
MVVPPRLSRYPKRDVTLLSIIRASQTLLFDDGGWTKALAPKEEQLANAMTKAAYNFIVVYLSSLFDRFSGDDLRGML